MPLLGESTYTVNRYSITRVKGQAARALVSTFTVVGSLQPLSGSQRRDLPEGSRVAGTKCLYAAKPHTLLSNLDQSAGRYSDEVIDGSTVYEVLDVKDYPNHAKAVDHVEYILRIKGIDES